MADKKIVGWFTVNGNHIPVFEGEKKSDAFKRVFKYDDVKNKNPKKYSSRENFKKLSKPTTDTAVEHYWNKNKELVDKENAAYSKLYDDEFMERRYAGDTKYESEMWDNYKKANEEANKAYVRAREESEKPRIKSAVLKVKKKSVAGQNEEIKTRQIAINKEQAEKAAGKIIPIGNTKVSFEDLNKSSTFFAIERGGFSDYIIKSNGQIQHKNPEALRGVREYSRGYKNLGSSAVAQSLKANGDYEAILKKGNDKLTIESKDLSDALAKDLVSRGYTLLGKSDPCSYTPYYLWEKRKK